ncbi:fimbrial protein [Porphyromonas pogonae]|uniref:fimbrial protein n=1 Tax=Porphyromonas pogonae TaxID=867595 RepID=UPI002E78BB83|nr:DUF4906 domain-containing protein [Porphyromonas pogonae]
MKVKINRNLLHSTLQISVILSFLSCFFSCTDDNRDNPELEGHHSIIELSVAMGDFPKESVMRSSISPEQENKVWNLYLFIFNTDGTIQNRQFFPYNPSTDKLAGEDASGKVKLKTISGKKSIYAVANIGEKSPLADITKEQLDAITSKQALQDLIISYRTGFATLSRTDGKLLMAGKIEDHTIIPGITTNTLNIPLTRVCSKVKFTVNTASNVKFTPRTWRVLRIPNKVRLFASSTDKVGLTSSSDFFDSEKKEFESIIKPDGGVENSFTFYQYENKKQSKSIIIGSGSNPTADAFYKREKQDKTSTGINGNVTNGAFTYADLNATYVQIEGSLEIQNGSTRINAQVTYTIHLGYVDANANDFDCKRNTYYNYTVTINGIENIKVEAMATSADIEPNPGAEGSSVVRSTNNLSFDAHYATTWVRIARSVATLANPYYVNTPFERHGVKDINWIKFVKNPVGNNQSITTYPGESSSSLMNPQQMIERLKQAHTSNEANFFVRESDGLDYTYFTVFLNEFYYDKDPLNPSAVSDPSLWKKFVNQPAREFVMAQDYYLSKDGKSSFADNALLIRQESIKTTYDLSSSKAVGFEVMDENWGRSYTIESGSNKANTDPLDGWKNSALDWELAIGDPRTATWTQDNNHRWSNFVNLNAIVSQNNYGWGTYQLITNGVTNPKTSTSNTARYACLARNRDLNGNGYIDKDELRWYLPAVEQLVNVWIGSSAIGVDDQLYRTSQYYSQLNRPLYVLYFSSTSWDNTSRSNPTILWSKEGTSTSAIAGPAVGNWFPGGYNLGYDKFYTRCMRNLGNSDPSVQPASTVKWDVTNRIISLIETVDKLYSGAYRNTDVDFMTTELPSHTERSPQNIPAKRFKVANKYLGEQNGGAPWVLSWNALRATTTPVQSCNKDYYEKSDQSDKGKWRVPNQRELQLMSRTKVIGSSAADESTFIWSATGYTYSLSLDPPMPGYTGGNRDRALRGSNKMLTALEKTESLKVRCVRDLKSNQLE